MNSLKTMLVMAVLASVAYGVYVTINNPVTPAPPPGVAEDWQSGPPSISLPDGFDAPGFSFDGPGQSPVAGTPPTAGRWNDLASSSSFDAPPPPFRPAPMPPASGADSGSFPPPQSSSDREPLPSDQAPLPTGQAYLGSAPVSPPGDQGRFGDTAPPWPSDSSSLGSAPAAPPAAPTGLGQSAPPWPSAPSSLGSAPVSPPAGQAGFGEAAPPWPSAGGMAAPHAARQQPRPDEIRPEFAQFLGDARSDLDQGLLAETLASLSARYGEPDQTAAEAAALIELLDQVAGSVIYSTDHLLEPPHVVRPGETLPQIAEQYAVPWELLGKINGVADPQVLEPGRQLKVVRGPFQAVVNLDSHELILWLEDLYAGRFPIGVGSDQPQLEGSFTVREKLTDPTYYAPSGRVVAAGDPNNPLGKLRIGLSETVAIHGTNNPAHVGSTGSAGTVCLGDRDIDDVYDILSIGSRVVIRR